MAGGSRGANHWERDWGWCCRVCGCEARFLRSRFDEGAKGDETSAGCCPSWRKTFR